MIRTIGFLSGVCLTVAALLLVLDSRESQAPETVTQASTDATAEELSGVSAAIAEQVDIVPVGNESEQAIPPEHAAETADSEPQNDIVETGVDVTAASVAQADVVPATSISNKVTTADQESGTVDTEPQPGFEPAGLDQQHRVDVQVEAQADDSDPPDSGDAGTYLFWSPFRSEWAARGFAGRLTLATQVPVEVINAGPGEYRAAFSYQDETERLAQIERIETITGLKLE